MTQAVVVRKLGDDFQGRLFWFYAALLLIDSSNVVRVAFETGPKAFDDVLVGYDAGRPSLDHRGQKVLRDHFQCKWHVRPGEFGHQDLINPAFTNAATFSFLQRALQSQQQHAPDGNGARFRLLTNWRLAADDPLAKILHHQSNAFDMDKLFDGSTDRSAMGKMRKIWRDHLAIDDAALRLLASTLGITLRLESLEDLRMQLNDRFTAAGMRTVPDWETPFVYDDLISKLHAQGRADFNRKTFRDLCGDEKLLATGRDDRPLTLGVRSFVHPIDNLDARCDATLNLVPHFDGRYIRNEADWQGTLAPELRTFLVDAAKTTDHIRLALDAHVSLAFGVGAVLNVKSGKTVEVEQRTGGRRFWAPTDLPDDPAWPKLQFVDEATADPGQDIALAVSLTHDVTDGVRAYIAKGPGIARIVHVRLDSGPSGRSVRCGRHAHRLAEQITAYVRALAGVSTPRPTVHAFLAVPNAFAFFLGQNQPALGHVAVYEWDFEGGRGGGYSIGLEFR